ncbi:peroxiredoxin [Alphaproteobacteria bacterium]|nr:peroxiredoxin [Alphaproteobacteria bacterium]
MTIEIGKKITNFNLPSSDGNAFELNSITDKKLILFFYPKDDTPGCTKEAIEFSKFKNKFLKYNSIIIGISKDSIDKHNRFIKKHKLKINLLSDIDTKICNKFGTYKEKMNYGKKYMGIERSTFIIDENKKVLKIWRKVKVLNHVEEVYNFIKGL